MSTPRELLHALQKVIVATATLKAIKALPRRKGSLVMWTNGVVWRRLGDDAWEALHRTERYESRIDTYGTFPSDHVATSAGSFREVTRLKRLPGLDPEKSHD